MSEQDSIYLRQLHSCANDACDAARGDSKASCEAVNWGDLGCVRVTRWYGLDNTSGWQVWIEEASPDAEALQWFIQKYLSDEGFGDVEVYTEW